MDEFWHVRLRRIRLMMLVMTVVFMRGAANTYAEQSESGSSSVKSPSANVSNALKQLQGKWTSVKSTYKDANYCDGMAIHFRDDRAIETITAGNKEQSVEEGGQINFTVDESKTPMWIDFGHQKGIFRMEGDLLMVCVGNEKCRPTKFNLVAAPAEVRAVGYWVPKELSWETNCPRLWVFKKTP